MAFMSPKSLEDICKKSIVTHSRNTITQPLEVCAHEDQSCYCASRGIFPSQLLENNMWWSGPLWLIEPKDSWPIQPNLGCDSEFVLGESKSDTVLVVEVDPHPVISLLGKFSSCHKIQRIVAYIRRFGSWTDRPKVFMSCFNDIIQCLKKRKLLPKPFCKLSLF